MQLLPTSCSIQADRPIGETADGLEPSGVVVVLKPREQEGLGRGMARHVRPSVESYTLGPVVVDRPLQLGTGSRTAKVLVEREGGRLRRADTVASHGRLDRGCPPLFGDAQRGLEVVLVREEQSLILERRLAERGDWPRNRLERGHSSGCTREARDAPDGRVHQLETEGSWLFEPGLGLRGVLGQRSLVGKQEELLDERHEAGVGLLQVFDEPLVREGVMAAANRDCGSMQAEHLQDARVRRRAHGKVRTEGLFGRRCTLGDGLRLELCPPRKRLDSSIPKRIHERASIISGC